MSVAHEYFSAATEGLAAATVDWVGGPEAGRPKGLFSAGSSGFPVVHGREIEPVDMLGALEAILGGRTLDEWGADPETRRVIALRTRTERLVARVDPTFVQRIAATDRETLPDLAWPWSEDEEFAGSADITQLQGFLLEFQELARRAVQTSELVYCWISV
jgi:hypothetical protein